MSLTFTIDQTPLTRPLPLAIVMGSRAAVLGRIGTMLAAQGFQESSRDIDQGELRAIRPDKVATGARDEVLVWTEGQAGDAARIRVYLAYGRYERIWGNNEPQRVRPTSDEVETRIGALQRSVRALVAV